VVFTNGVFDLLHPGHVMVLESARAAGASLIVGINDDASAARLHKGPGRPFANVAARTRVVAALGAVDCIVVFSEDTPEDLLRTLTPDVLVKGGDYGLQQVVGREMVESWGGRVLTIPFESGYSTTAMVERIRAAS